MNGGNYYQAPASLRGVLMNGILPSSSMFKSSSRFPILSPRMITELREYKRHLIPFPRVGKRQTLIPFPRVGRAFLTAAPADDNLDEEDFAAGLITINKATPTQFFLIGFVL